MAVNVEDLRFDLEKYREIISDDPLFEYISDTEFEEQLFSEDYLANLEEKRWYSTNEIADWFGISDGQLRYYVKPFHQYLFSEDNPSLSTAYRINIEGVLKLRMIIMLKDEYKLKGLKRILGVEGRVEPRTIESTSMPADPSAPNPNNMQQELNFLKGVFEQLMVSGLLEMKENEDGSTSIGLNSEIQKLTTLKIESQDDVKEEVAELKEQLEKLEQERMEYKELLEQEQSSYEEKIEELREEHRKNREDVALKLRERQLETKILSELRAEGLKQWAEANKPSMMQRLFKGDQLELDREQFILKHITDNLNERLKLELEKYRKDNQE